MYRRLVDVFRRVFLCSKYLQRDGWRFEFAGDEEGGVDVILRCLKKKTGFTRKCET